YWMTLHTPLTVTERYRHSHDIFPDANRTQPFGSGATCVYNYFDLQILNSTEDDYQLIVYLDDGNLHGEWRCSKPAPFKYEVYEREHSITSGLWGGYIRNNLIHRKEYDNYGKFIKDELVAENHAVMTYAPFLEPAQSLNAGT
ncbi:MAG: VanW family protein, partial [Bacillota bacterium]|nr:VanW family protein [Bacillota bacterium]